MQCAFCTPTPVNTSFSSFRTPLSKPSPQSPAKWECSRMTRRRHKLPGIPRPLPARVLPDLPQPGETNQRISATVRRGRGGIYETIRSSLGSRCDVSVISSSPLGLVSAILSRRERDGSALIILPTQEAARRAVQEAELDRRGARLITALGSNFSTSDRPALFANNSQKQAIVITTPRALVRDFCESGHGRPWLSRVRFLGIFDLEAIITTGARKELERILRALSPVAKRRNFIWAPKEIPEELTDLYQQLIRNSCKKINDDQSEHIETSGNNTEVKKLDKYDLKPLVNQAGYRTKGEVLGSFHGIRHEAIVATQKQQMGFIWNQISERARSDRPARMIIMFQTGRIAEWYATLSRSLGIDVIDVHSRTTSGKRDAGLEKFYNNPSSILFCTDTVIDNAILPQIDYLIQIGMPNIVDQYFKRTSVIGTENGSSWILMTKDEAKFCLEKINESIKQKKDLDLEIKRTNYDEKKTINKQRHFEMLDGSTKAKMKAYLSWLGYYSKLRSKLGWSKKDLVVQANEWAMAYLEKIPGLSSKSIDKLWLRGVDGLKIEELPK